MSFFGLTGLGYQDSIKSRLYEKPDTPPSTGLSDFQSKPLRLPPIPHTGRVVDHYNNYTNPEKGNERSYSKHITLLKKHVRSRYSPNELYRIPLSDANNSGWLIPNDGQTLLHDKFSWAHTPRFVHVNSEMTRFVDEMALTNREFSLF
ncbi:sperm microtubule inner protein 11-like [Styela clava]